MIRRRAWTRPAPAARPSGTARRPRERCPSIAHRAVMVISHERRLRRAVETRVRREGLGPRLLSHVVALAGPGEGVGQAGDVTPVRVHELLERREVHAHGTSAGGLRVRRHRRAGLAVGPGAGPAAQLDQVDRDQRHGPGGGQQQQHRDGGDQPVPPQHGLVERVRVEGVVRDQPGRRGRQHQHGQHRDPDRRAAGPGPSATSPACAPPAPLHEQVRRDDRDPDDRAPQLQLAVERCAGHPVPQRRPVRRRRTRRRG